MLLATPEQRTVRLGFPRAGPFGPLGRPKDIRERLEENKSERQRLRRTAEYNGKRSELHSEFLLTRIISALDFYISKKGAIFAEIWHNRYNDRQNGFQG